MSRFIIPFCFVPIAYMYGRLFQGSDTYKKRNMSYKFKSKKSINDFPELLDSKITPIDRPEIEKEL